MRRLVVLVACCGCVHALGERPAVLHVRAHNQAPDDLYTLESVQIRVDGVVVFDSAQFDFEQLSERERERYRCEELARSPRPPGCTALVYDGRVAPGLRHVDIAWVLGHTGTQQAVALRAHAWVDAVRGHRSS